MKIKYFGHACFMITTRNGIKILFDPYQHGAFDGAVGYKPVKVAPDIVCISHTHADHSYIDELEGKPEIIAGEGAKIVGEVAINGIKTYHDKKNGRERGINIVYVIQVDGAKIVHCGDLGAPFDDRQATIIGTVDFLFVPVGGVFTIDAHEAYIVTQKLKAKYVFPMHYKTPHIGFPLDPVDKFLSKFPEESIVKYKENEIELLPPNFDDPQKVIVMDYVK